MGGLLETAEIFAALLIELFNSYHQQAGRYFQRLAFFNRQLDVTFFINRFSLSAPYRRL